jgi:serine/threonine protein kinase
MADSNQFKLSKRIRFVSKLLGTETAFELFGGKKLGEGAFGKVFATKGSAVKVGKGKEGKSSLANELKILKEIQRIKSAPKLLGSGKGYLALKKFEGSPLYSKENLAKIKSDPTFADYIFRKIVEAIGALHRKNVAQRDLHGGNIFITKNYQVKILDYGQAKTGYASVYYETFFGSNSDPRQGAVGLVYNLFEKTSSYKIYYAQLQNAVKRICKKKGIDPKIALLDYEDIDGDEEATDEYFETLHVLASPPEGDTSDVPTFYTFLDSGLRINTRNPGGVRDTFESDIKIGNKSNNNKFIKKAILSSNNISSFANKNIPKAESGGVFNAQGKKLPGSESYAKAIRPIKKNGRDNTELAVSSLISYRVFPHTTEGIQKAEKIISAHDMWLVPSLMDGYYYNGIDSDLMTGNMTPGIRFIANAMREFYGISSSGTESAIDTRKSARPNTPPGIKINWFSLNQVGPSVWMKLKAQLTGKGYFSEVNLSEKDADELIANIKKSGEFPSLEDDSGIHNEVYQNWLVDTYLPNYSNTKVYKPEEKFGDDIIEDLDKKLQDDSDKIMDAIDEIIEADNKKYEDFKKQLNKKVNHPKLPPDLQKIEPRYTWGVHGSYFLDFESDIDKAIYYAVGGSKNKNKRGETLKKRIREWLFSVTGLNYYDDYEEIKEYKNKILVFIVTGLREDTIEDGYDGLVIPPIYDGPYQDPEEDEEEEDEEEEDDDLYGNSLDDLLGNVRDEEAEDPEDPEELKDQIEEKKKELEDAVEQEQNTTGRKTLAERMQEAFEDKFGEDFEEDEDDDDFEEIDYEEVLNKKRKETGTKERKSYYVSNTKLLQGITKSLLAVTGQLEQVNQSLIEQNQLLQTNVDLNLASLEALQAQDDILATKFDAILNAFQQQYEAAQKAEEEAKRLRAEQRLESKNGSSGSETPDDLTKGGKGGGRKNRIYQYFREKLIRQLYRKLPKRVRALRTRGRKLQRMPGRAVGRVTNTVASRISRMLPSKVSNFGRNITTARSAVKGMGGFSKFKGVGKNIPGLKQALAVWEYGDRKAAGQSDIQASIGVGGGLAGAAAGAAIGTMLFPGVGTVAGLLIGAAFSAAGGYAGSKIADKFTGVKDKQYERGTQKAKPGMSVLHGTELLISGNKNNLDPINQTGQLLLGATSGYINSLGPAGASIAPVFKQKAAPLIKIFGLPATIARSKVGGNFTNIKGAFKSIDKKIDSVDTMTEENLSMEEKDLFKLKNSDTFADKLLSILDPENRFQNLLQNLNRHFDTPPIPLSEGGYATFGKTGRGSNAKGWVHGHFQNSNSKAELLRDTFPFVRKLLDQGSEVVITGGVDRPLTKDMDDNEVKEMISKGIDTHSNRTKGYFAVDVSVREGTKVPFALQDVRNTGGNEGISGLIPGTNTFIGHLAEGSRSGGPSGSPVLPSTTAVKPSSAIVKDLGKQNVMSAKDFGQTSGVGSNGYIIIPGHATGGGAPGEKEMVKSLARNAYNNIKRQNPSAKVLLMDLDEKFPDTDAGWEAQKKWYQQKEKEGYEILEVHLDGKGGTGKGIIVPHRELNAVEAEFARTHGAYPRDWRSKKGEEPLAGPNRGISLIELGNVPENLTQGVMNYLTKPLEDSVLKVSGGSLNSISSLQGNDGNPDTKYLIINQRQKPQDLQVLGFNNDVKFISNGNGGWKTTKEISKTLRQLYLQRLSK